MNNIKNYQKAVSTKNDVEPRIFAGLKTGRIINDPKTKFNQEVENPNQVRISKKIKQFVKLKEQADARLLKAEEELKKLYENQEIEYCER